MRYANRAWPLHFLAPVRARLLAATGDDLISRGGRADRTKDFLISLSMRARYAGDKGNRADDGSLHARTRLRTPIKWVRRVFGLGSARWMHSSKRLMASH